MRLTMGALLALLYAALAPGAARASCGDYLMPKHRPATPTDQAAPAPLTNHDPAPHPLPCSGPTCSRGQPTLPASSPPAPDRHQEWGCPVVFLLNAGPDSSAYLGDVEQALPSPLPTSVYHPPRFSF